MLIDSFEALEAFCTRAGSSDVLAVDTEFLRERTFYPRLCLVQVATEQEQAAIDVLALEDLAPLRRLLTNDAVTKVFHSCSQDLEVLKLRFGAVPCPVFDTQLAAGFLGHRMQLGYAALVSAYTGVRLDKADTLTDWSRRPLEPSQVAYAEDDVRYLPGIYRAMVAELVERDRLTWVLPEMGELVSRAEREEPLAEAYLHVKRFGTLHRGQLAVLRELAAWREVTAREKDLPRKWVLSDEVLVELAKHAPRNQDRLRRVRGTQGLSAAEAEGVLAAVAKGRSCPPAAWPRPPKGPARPADGTSFQDQESVVDLMYAMLRLLSDRAQVAPQLVARREDLVDFMHDPDAPRLRTGWRNQLVGEALTALLAGEAGLTVRGGRLEVI